MMIWSHDHMIICSYDVGTILDNVQTVFGKLQTLFDAIRRYSNSIRRYSGDIRRYSSDIRTHSAKQNKNGRLVHVLIFLYQAKLVFHSTALKKKNIFRP